jgi:hypothetical protein
MKKIYLTIQLSLLTLLIKAQFCSPVNWSTINVSSTSACGGAVITCSATGGSLPSGAYYNWRAMYNSGSACSSSNGIDFGQQGSPVNVVNGSQFTMPTTGQTTYYIRLTAVCSNGVRTCASTDIAVSRIGAPTITAPNTQVPFYPGTPASMSVSATPSTGVTYAWTKDGVTVSGANAATLNIASPTATNAGVYRCLVTNACGTTTSSAITFTTLGNQNVSGAVTTATNTSKAYSVVNQSASGVTYNWSLSGGGTITTATNTNSVSVGWGNTVDTYTLTLDKTLGACQVTDTRTVSVVACTTNTANILIDGIITNTVCEGNTVNLYPSSQGPTYAWSNGSSNFAISITPTANVTYSLAYTDNVGCALTGSLNVTVNPLPQFSISATSTKLCPNQTATLTITNGINLASYDWGNNSMSDTNPYEVIHDDVSATYTITANGYNGSLQCKTTETIIVTAYLNPTVTALASNTTICNGESTTLLAGGASSYTWNPSIPTNNVVSPTSTTTYSVIVENAGNCSGSNQITINVQACTGIDELTNSSFSLHPNPAKDFLIVEGINNSSYTILNLLGETVLSGKIDSQINHIDISNLKSGLYFVNINNKSVKRFIKE